MGPGWLLPIIGEGYDIRGSDPIIMEDCGGALVDGMGPPVSYARIFMIFSLVGSVS